MTKEIFQIAHFKANKAKNFSLQVSDDGIAFLSIRDATVEPNIKSTLALSDSELALITMKIQAYLLQKQFNTIDYTPKPTS